MKGRFLLRGGLVATVGIFVLGLCLTLTHDLIKGQMQSNQKRSRKTLARVAESIAFFQKKNGRLPQSLSELEGLPDRFIRPAGEGRIRDSWGTPILYESHGNKYVLTSLGKDGKAGGFGLDYDLTSNEPNPSQAEPSLIQVLGHESAIGMLLASLACALVSTLLAAGAITGDSLRRENMPIVAVKLFITLVGTSIVALFVTMLHYPSGH